MNDSDGKLAAEWFTPKCSGLLSDGPPPPLTEAEQAPPALGSEAVTVTDLGRGKAAPSYHH
jgi:hypothetical protein